MKKRFVAIATVLALVGSCTASDEGGGPTPAPRSVATRGGTLRVATWLRTVQQLDPATSYIAGIHWEIYRCCLLRTLMSYNGQAAVDGGSEAQPDLAKEPPEVTSDGLRWTFRLREGLRYAPPWEGTEILARDIVRALERIPPPQLGVYEYGHYYSVIDGFDAFRAGDADSIAGLETPDDHTLVVHLTEPAGDLPERFALHATAPVPEGAAEGHERDWFRFLAASGPYMIEGSPEVDISLSAGEQQPVSGFIPQREIDASGKPRVGLTLVRNPSWDRSTDPLRAAYADRIEFVLIPSDQVNTAASARSVGRRLDEGSIDHAVAGSSEQLQRYRSDPILQDRVVLAPQSDIFYLPFNMAVPPFDDVETRRAVNLAIDKLTLAERFTKLNAPGSEFAPLTHILPESTEAGLLGPEWQAAWASGVGPEGDLAAAREAMARSRYDSDGDGMCDADACGDVPVLVDKDAYSPGVRYPWFWRQIQDDLAGIGISIDPTMEECFTALDHAGRPSQRNALFISVCNAWLVDFPNGSSFFKPLLHGRSISDEHNPNQSLLGAQRRDLRRWGYDVTSVPSIDERIDACLRRTGHDQIECWANLDRYTMDEIVPWVPLLTTSRVFLVSDRVTDWSYSEFGLRPALDRIALAPGAS